MECCQDHRGWPHNMVSVWNSIASNRWSSSLLLGGATKSSRYTRPSTGSVTPPS